MRTATVSLLIVVFLVSVWLVLLAGTISAVANAKEHPILAIVLIAGFVIYTQRVWVTIGPRK